MLSIAFKQSRSHACEKSSVETKSLTSTHYTEKKHVSTVVGNVELCGLWEVR